MQLTAIPQQASTPLPHSSSPTLLFAWTLSSSPPLSLLLSSSSSSLSSFHNDHYHHPGNPSFLLANSLLCPKLPILLLQGRFPHCLPFPDADESVVAVGKLAIFPSRFIVQFFASLIRPRSSLYHNHQSNFSPFHSTLHILSFVLRDTFIPLRAYPSFSSSLAHPRFYNSLSF